METKNLLEKVLDTLLALKASTRDTAEPCVRERLDEAIRDIQLLIENGESDDAAHSVAIVHLGRVFEKMPSIVALIKLFSG